MATFHDMKNTVSVSYSNAMFSLFCAIVKLLETTDFLSFKKSAITKYMYCFKIVFCVNSALADIEMRNKVICLFFGGKDVI